MASLQYRGRTPDADYAVVPKSYADNTYADLRVDSDYITAAVAASTAPLVSASYVTAQDAMRAHITDVDTADGNYLLATQLGAVSGVAQLGSDGLVPSGSLPALPTERKPFVHSYDTLYLSDDHVVTSTATAKEYKVATLTIADPGFPYIPLPFVVIRGGAVGASGTPDRTMATPNVGQISVYDSSNVRHAWTLCTGRRSLDYYTAVPFADDATTPTSRTPVTGTVTFDAWLGLWSGTSYTFNATAGTGFQYYIICNPAL